MSENEADDIKGEPKPNPDKLPETEASAMPLDPDNPQIFKHAYPKPDGDLWEILLKPQLEADTTRCEAWKDEVQNLLIFAGLFSAVVTAFIIESYKFLQPGPNATIEGLLFHIANSLNNTSPLPPSLVPVPFLPTSSSVRINVYWFISLILSLTTVLVGTVALQWLREHQSYPDVSTKEKLAIFHMRSEALDVWCVPQIFSALPVLLQAAVALFLVGLINFILPLGRKLTIPVSIIIGLTLFFLAATTALPTLQGFFFLTSFYPGSQPPSPCAFKSPQSRVLLSISAPPIYTLSYIIFQIYKHQNFYPPMFRRYTALPYLRNVLRQRTWPNLDQAWLRLRDAYHQCILDKDPALYDHQQMWSRYSSFPISDITQYLVKSVLETPSVKDLDKFLSAAIYGFHQISASIWTDIQNADQSLLDLKIRHNNYFQKLHGNPSCSISNYLIYSGYYQMHENNESVESLQICNHDQLFYFLGLIQKHHPSPKLGQYRQELWSYIISNIQTKPRAIPIPKFSLIPTLLEFETLQSVYSSENAMIVETAVNIIGAVFKSGANYRISQDQFMNSLYTHPHMAVVLDQLACSTASNLRWTTDDLMLETTQELYGKIDYLFERMYPATNLRPLRYKVQSLLPTDTHFYARAQYVSIFKFVTIHLIGETSSNSEEQISEEDTPSTLFYLTAIFMWRFLDHILLSHWDHLKNAGSSTVFGEQLMSLLEVLLEYRMWIRTASKKNEVLETRFAQNVHSKWKAKDMDRFSEEWWDVLFECGRYIGLKAAERGPPATEESGRKTRPSSSSQDKQNAAVVTALATSSPLASPAIIHDSPASTALEPDSKVADHNEISHTGLQSTSLVRTVSHDDHDKDTKRQASSGSPTTAEHMTETITVLPLKPIPNLPFTQLQTSRAVENPPGIRLPEGEHAASDSAVQAPSPSQISLQSAAGMGTNPQEAAANPFGNEQVTIQAGAPHFTIDVESPIALEQSELFEVADSGHGAPEDQHVNFPN